MVGAFVAGIVLSVGVGVGVATIPGSDGMIAACYDKSTGALRVKDAESGDRCRGNERRISWPASAPAPKPVVYTYRSVQAEGGAARVFCNPGEKVTGGGGYTSSDSEGLTQSFPIGDATGVNAFGQTAVGWQVANEDFGDTVVAFVICASS
jgi:hypothetical protein